MGIVMHFLVPVSRPVAPHMVSGEPAGAMPLAKKIGARIGHQGQPFGAACNPRISMNETHRGTGEPWALLTAVDGNVVVPESACQACMATEAWKKAIAENPHPGVKQAVQKAADTAEGCCG